MGAALDDILDLTVYRARSLSGSSPPTLQSNEAHEWYSHLVESKLRGNVYTNGQTFGGKGQKMGRPSYQSLYIKAKKIIAAFLVWLNINLFSS